MIASLLVAVAVVFATTEAYSTRVTLGFEMPPGTHCYGMFTIKLKDSDFHLLSTEQIFTDLYVLKPASFVDDMSLGRIDFNVDHLGNVSTAKHVDIDFYKIPFQDKSQEFYNSEGCWKVEYDGIKIHYVGLTPEGEETSMFTVGGEGPSDGGQLPSEIFRPNYYYTLTRYGSWTLWNGPKKTTTGSEGDRE